MVRLPNVKIPAPAFSLFSLSCSLLLSDSVPHPLSDRSPLFLKNPNFYKISL
ncbi:hypothetical protein CCACVL1_08805 [Corchorus capsularis]|uniref:Uncharacterized protein n=1 Tax=Corchorus capsularis TaxID=210143 RepID=A0A1R3IYR2_COCAP|nr:hypothetical protein CCACVL1_08805 [Corchorus capsularis]